MKPNTYVTLSRNSIDNFALLLVVADLAFGLCVSGATITEYVSGNHVHLNGVRVEQGGPHGRGQRPRACVLWSSRAHPVTTCIDELVLLRLKPGTS